MEEMGNQKSSCLGNKLLSLPKINSSQRFLKQVLSCENAFKFCRVGTKKNKFINFDLKYTDDQNALFPRRQMIKIPLLVLNRNYFSPYRDKKTEKSSHRLQKYMYDSQIHKKQPPLSQIRNSTDKLSCQVKFKKNTEHSREIQDVFIT